MANLATYTKDTEANITGSAPSGDGEMAFSTDTGKLFLSKGTVWVEWHSDREYGNYTLASGSGFASATLDIRPTYHFDPSDASTVFEDDGGTISAAENGDGVAQLTCKASGIKLEQDQGSAQPTYISSAGSYPLGETSGDDAMINSLPVLQFNDSFMGYDPFGFGSQSQSRGATVAVVLRNRQATASAAGTAGYQGLFASAYYGTALNQEHQMYFRDNYNPPYLYQGGFNALDYWSAGATTLQTADPAWDDGTPRILIGTVSCPGFDAGGYLEKAMWMNGTTAWWHRYLAASHVNRKQIVSAGFMIGAVPTYGFTTGYQRWGGELGEFLWFNSALDRSTINLVGNYLADKWVGATSDWADL